MDFFPTSFLLALVVTLRLGWCLATVKKKLPHQINPNKCVKTLIVLGSGLQPAVCVWVKELKALVL